MPYLSSNASSKIFYASLRDEIPRFGRTTTDFNKFKLLCETLITRIINQVAKLKSIERSLCKIYGRNFEVSLIFANTCENFITFLYP